MTGLKRAGGTACPTHFGQVVYCLEAMNYLLGRADAAVRIVALVLVASGLVWAAGPELDVARKYYDSTDFAKSLQVLQPIPAKDGAVWELIGRNYYMQREYAKASEALEKAVAADRSNSEHELWLARAYGRRAETASPFTAPGQALKARQHFEKSVQLNPRNLEALSDLFEYYLEAPGFLGGGLDKAVATAGRIAALDAAEGHLAQAKLAEKKKEYRSAEEHLERAIESAPQQAGRLIDLARFLASQGRYQEAERSFGRAESVAPGSAQVLYARAETYIKYHNNVELAKKFLMQYLSLKLTVDDPPRSDAEKLLRRVQGS
jgi:tetratricopeptide (TPR) repeat protein